MSRKHILHAIDDSLRRLGTDYVDLYQIHRFDYDTPIEETLEALDDVVKAGKALYIGASSMFAWQFAKMLYKADELGLTRFVSMQNHYNLIYREEEREMIPLCRAGGHRRDSLESAGARLSGGQPAARRISAKRCAENRRIRAQAVLPGLGFRGSGSRDRDGARKRGVPNAQVALAWMLQQPGVTAPIVGASKMQHLEDAVAALEMKLDEAELKALDEPYRPHPVLGHS